MVKNVAIKKDTMCSICMYMYYVYTAYDISSGRQVTAPRKENRASPTFHIASNRRRSNGCLEAITDRNVNITTRYMAEIATGTIQ